MKPGTVDKALQILDLLIGSPQGMRATDLARQTGFPPGTLHRLLGSLTGSGFVRQDFTTSRYTLGHKFLQGFNEIVRGLGLQEKALPHLKRLAQLTGHGANLGVLRGDQVVFLESTVFDGAGPVMYTPPGTLAPSHCTAMGKAMLAYLPEPDLRCYLHTTSLTTRTPNSITTPSHLVEHLAEVRRLGYAVDDEEYNLGVRCVGAPVRNHSGRVVAAVSVSLPGHLLPRERIPILAGLVKEAAQAVSTDLGYVPTLRESGSVSSAGTTF